MTLTRESMRRIIAACDNQDCANCPLIRDSFSCQNTWRKIIEFLPDTLECEEEE